MKNLLLAFILVLSISSISAQNGYERGILPEYEDLVDVVPEIEGDILIPIQVHIVRRGDGLGGIPSVATFNTQLEDLNEKFAGKGFQFYTEPEAIEHIDDDLWVYTLTDSILDNNVPGKLNIYITYRIQGGSFGLFSSGFTWPIVKEKNGIVILSQYFGDKVTLPHFIGHYFGLKNTHGEDAFPGSTDELVNGSEEDRNTGGDDVADTPADPNMAGVTDTSCTYLGKSRDANGDLYVPEFNVMSYAQRGCGQILTPGQGYRMRQIYQLYCENLLCDESLSTTTETTERFRIYPNPVERILTIEGLFESYVVYDITGKKVLEGTDNEINFEGLSPGNYIINIFDQNKRHSKKLIKI